MRIRLENIADHAVIHAVNRAAFGRSSEADLVDLLRRKVGRLVSLVADIDGATVGHILFSPVSLSGFDQMRIMWLGPMAVVPDQQRRGIGSTLVREGLMRCKRLGCQAVVVLGHPEFYPRFGYVPAANYGIRSEYAVPQEVFMIVELETNALAGVSGVIHYDEAFSSL